MAKKVAKEENSTKVKTKKFGITKLIMLMADCQPLLDKNSFEYP